MFNASFQAVAQYLRERTVEVRGSEPGGGSGVIWSDDGLIVTNAHVARDGTPVIGLPDGRTLSGRLVAHDRRRDLAAIRIDAHGLPHAAAGDSSVVRPGEIVFASGNPLGVKGVVTQGVIHAASSRQWIQADVRLAPGNSGGALANACGEVIGINTMIYGGLALAAPSQAVERFLNGNRTPRLGVTLRPVQVAGRVGLMILELETSGPAVQAGMMTGDVLLLSLSELQGALESASEKGEVAIDFLRAGHVSSVVISFRLATAGARAA
jgi:serine protease Do